MKGLILSGGHGVRLRPLTYSQQKQLIPVANKPILFYCIEDIIRAGVESIGIIVGPNREQVIDEVTSTAWDAEIEFIYQEYPGGLAHAVKISEDFLGNDDFIMYLGDNILMGGINGFVSDFKDSNVEASILLTPVSNPEQFGVALVDWHRKVILELVEKPKNPTTNTAVVGIYGFTPKIFEAIEHIDLSWRGELEITDALHWMIKNGCSVRCGMVEGWWKDTGKPEDLLDANRRILDALSLKNGTLQENGGHIENNGIVRESTLTGRVMIGKNSVIEENTVVKGPVIIGDDCVISGAYLGPYTSIGNGSHIVNTEIEDSIVMSGSTIINADRVVESLVGKNVCIEKNTKPPMGRRFVIGDNSSVIL